MDDIVQIQPKASYASLSAALTLSNGHRVALLFPTGERTCLHDATALAAFRKRCQLLGKEAAIIGGDAWLRAHAVAAGFETATTLEDWGETAPQTYAIPSPRVRGGSSHLRLVTQPSDYMYDVDEEDAWASEPPDYVVELRKAFPRRSPAVRTPTISSPLRAATVERDDEADDPVTASERFEEMMIGRILETSGIHRPEARGIL